MNLKEQADIIKQSVDIIDLITKYGYQTDRAGFMQCPFHAGDRTASLKVYKRNNSWTCFGCHKGGSVIDFVMHQENATMAEAIRILDGLYGLRLLQGSNIFVQEDKARRNNQHLKVKAYRLKAAQAECDLLDAFVELAALESLPYTQGRPSQGREWRTFCTLADITAQEAHKRKEAI